ncbi:MAG: hypothetical protein ABI417_18705 [Coleofasciculaceae cyanobacterium]
MSDNETEAALTRVGFNASTQPTKALSLKSDLFLLNSSPQILDFVKTLYPNSIIAAV